MEDSAILDTVRTKYELLRPLMDERMRRQWAAAEALSLKRGGVTLVAQATGMSRTTIGEGMRELRERTNLGIEDETCISELPTRMRHPGGGRHPLKVNDPTLVRDLEALIEPTTRGDPQSPLRWTCKSTRNLAEALSRQGHCVSYQTVAVLLHELGYSLQALRKTREGGAHPDRDARFRYINQQVIAFQERGQPVVSVDTKKKELVGDFKTAGQEWQPEGTPEEARIYAFRDKDLGKVIPRGVYDLTWNEGWVSVGVDHDTAPFAAETLRRWWQEMGSEVYPEAQGLLITADAGGSNSYRSRLWKVAIQELADLLGFPISVCHFPPGTSKWNQIEHRMFSHLTQNWRGRPLVSRAVIVNLIGHTTTRTGLEIQAELDTGTYKEGIKVTDDELAAVRITRDNFHGEWNYTISPKRIVQLIS
ncbi:MAG TPA: ISAzo13 family transposase [Isosphaeraceae bacterium]|nr:ISAzo13 family transposase [Isosphaeraceae bacterium]